MRNTELHITVSNVFVHIRCRLISFLFREIASRNPHSFATDVWSLGILIVTLLTGRPPFDTDSKVQWNLIENQPREKFSSSAVHGTLSKVTQEKYELPTTFSDEAQDLVNSTLRKRPEDRPTIMGKILRERINDNHFFRRNS